MNKIIHVHSHPRSGTNYLLMLLKKNFYWDDDVSTPQGVWGHWSNRQPSKGLVYGRLFGNHAPFPRINGQALYVHRDGRAVALSCWRSDNVVHKDHSALPFSDFLKAHLDWFGSPGARAQTNINIVQSWYGHVRSWIDSADPRIIPIRFEDLVLDPEREIHKIAKRCGLDRKARFEPVGEKVGPSPNDGSVDSWKAFYTKDDLDFFHQTVPERCPYLYHAKL